MRHLKNGLIASKLAELGFKSVSKDLKPSPVSHKDRDQERIYRRSDSSTHLQELPGQVNTAHLLTQPHQDYN